MTHSAVNEGLANNWIFGQTKFNRLLVNLGNLGQNVSNVLTVRSAEIFPTLQDIIEPDPGLIEDIYAGKFTFGGRTERLSGKSSFENTDVPEYWAAELHGFGWLRHLSAAGSKVAGLYARTMVRDWINSTGSQLNSIAWRTDVASRRLQSWLAHSSMLIGENDSHFHKIFLRSIARHFRYLKRSVSSIPIGEKRITASISLVAASLSISSFRQNLPMALKMLDKELDHQILPDGGHLSRNPGALISILSDMLPVRQALGTQGLTPSNSMMTAIDRMIPMLRFFRHQDGTLARFNGMGETQTRLVDRILASDDSNGMPVDNARQSGFQRLTALNSTLIMDTGAIPPYKFSESVHAGCLSFEFSSNLNKIIVNCGIVSNTGKFWRDAARSTAAHSTATLEKESSCTFAKLKLLKQYHFQPIVSGPTLVHVERDESENQIKVLASHNGYAKSHDCLHGRSLILARTGTRLEGEDFFKPQSDKCRNHSFSIRFHLHPDVQVESTDNRQLVILKCKNGDEWIFKTEELELEVEESIYLSDTSSHKQSDQIAIHGHIKNMPAVHWVLERKL